jgi:chromosome segregation ATPase
MPTKKKEVKKEPEVNLEKAIDELWNVIDELQENLNFVNDKIKTISSRLGV